jgi:hypothetical protein
MSTAVDVRSGAGEVGGRAIGLDVHRDLCVVAICEDGEVRTAGRVPGTPEGLGLLAQSVVAAVRVALEVTVRLLGGCAAPRAARAAGGGGQPG